MTVFGLNILFDHLSYLPTLSNQTVNISSADDFAHNLCFRLLSYYCSCPCSSPHQIMNVSSINKPTNHRSRFTSLSTSNQTSVGTNTHWSHNPHFYYSYNFYHRVDMADNLKTINQELL